MLLAGDPLGSPTRGPHPSCAQLVASFHRFIGAEGYDLTALRTDLARFTFLLGHDDGEQLFGTDQT